MISPVSLLCLHPGLGQLVEDDTKKGLTAFTRELPT